MIDVPEETNRRSASEGALTCFIGTEVDILRKGSSLIDGKR